MTAKHFHNCYADFDGHRLIMGNAMIERRWRVSNGLLYAESLLDRAGGIEWITACAAAPSLYPPAPVVDCPREVEWSARWVDDHPINQPSMGVTLHARASETRGWSGTYDFVLYPGASGVVTRFTTAYPLSSLAQPEFATQPAPTGIESNGPTAPLTPTPDVLEALLFDPLHVDLTQVVMMDQSDVHDNLVREDRYCLSPAEPQLRLCGNLFVLEHRLTGRGLILLKHAPLPHARPVKNPVDLEIAGGSLRLFGHGFDLTGGAGYSSVILTYSGGRAGCTAALHAYQRQYRSYLIGRDGLLMSSTWGDRSRESKISESFMCQEIAAGAQLGVEVVAMDAGWEKGSSQTGANVWTGFWSLDENYWTPHPLRFPRGLAPVVAKAEWHGMERSLWYVADSSNDYVNWHRDAHQLLQLHRKHGIDFFKLDGLKIFSRLAEARFQQLLDTVRQESSGQITFDLDITANLRPGYWMHLDAGPLFVENRYTDWHRYWPHATLRNFWQLAHWIDPLRLRMEFLNNTRNVDLYGNDPLAPSCYRADYLFASVMLGSPLAWLETSYLPSDYIDAAAPLIATWKQHRQRLHASLILPVGRRPDGTSWTGFACADEAGGGDLLIFREFNDRPDCVWPVAMFPAAAYHVELLAGEGTADVTRSEAHLRIPEPLRFAWLRLTPH